MGLLDRILNFFFPKRKEQSRAERDEEERERETDQEEVTYHRKIIKSVFYCEGRTSHRGIRINVFSVTFEDNDTDRFNELLREIEVLRQYDRCHQVGDWGYDDQQTTTRPPFVYPIIEVGEE